MKYAADVTASTAAANASMITFRMIASSQAPADNTHRPGQQAPPHTLYPPGQADADVATHVAARIVASIPSILIVRMASLLLIPNRNGAALNQLVSSSLLYLRV